MSAADADTSQPHTDTHFIRHRGLALLPVLHGRLECAWLVRQAFLARRPRAIAVEFPPTLADAITRAVRRLPLLSVVHYREASGQLVYLLIEPTDPLVEAMRLGLEHEVPVFCIDRDTEGYPRHRESLPDPYALHRIGLTAYAEAYRASLPGAAAEPADLLREQTMAYHLQKLEEKYDSALAVFGLAHYPGLRAQLDRPQARPLERRRREGVQVAHLAEDSSREVLSEIPYLSGAYETARAGAPNSSLDRLDLHRRLVQAAAERYAKDTGESFSPHQEAVLHQFARNYALVAGQLTPDFYQLVVAARGVADDDLSYHVWDVGATYPWQEDKPGLPVIRIRGTDLFLNQKRIRFQRRLRTTRRRLVPLPGRRRPREKRPGEWKRLWQGAGICSYPPEDLVVEGFGDFAKKKATRLLSEQQTRVAPFTASLLDGIDVRETIRHWPEGVIYVREEQRLPGRVGAVVIIFDPDEEPEGKYPWQVTWLGEHAQESDMAFYATPAGEELVGPGISRCWYGGFLLSYPPWRLYDIWRDPFFGLTRTKPERLVLAALDYSLERFVVYIAARPPLSRWHTWAARYGKKLVYLPLGSFSPGVVKQLRRFHVLDGQPVRRWAPDFIR